MPDALFGRGIAFPPRVGADGRVAWSEGEDERPRGDPHHPDDRAARAHPAAASSAARCGRFLFEPNTVATRQRIQDRIEVALARWEPRIAVESVAVDAGPRRPAGGHRHHHLPARRHAGARARQPHGDAGQGERMPLTDPVARRPPLPGSARRSAGAHPGAQPGVDQLQPQRSRRHADRGLRVPDREPAVPRATRSRSATGASSCRCSAFRCSPRPRRAAS